MHFVPCFWGLVKKFFVSIFLLAAVQYFEADSQLRMWTPWTTWRLLDSLIMDMQLKLRQKERLKDRDRLAGTWYAYEPVGGAITIADSTKEQQTPLS